MHLSLANTQPDAGRDAHGEAGRHVAPSLGDGPRPDGGGMNAHNTFGAPDAVKPVAFTGATLKGDTLDVTLPAKSVVILDPQVDPRTTRGPLQRPSLLPEHSHVSQQALGSS